MELIIGKIHMLAYTDTSDQSMVTYKRTRKTAFVSKPPTNLVLILTHSQLSSFLKHWYKVIPNS